MAWNICFLNKGSLIILGWGVEMGAFQSINFSYPGLLMPSLSCKVAKHILSTFHESAV